MPRPLLVGQGMVIIITDFIKFVGTKSKWGKLLKLLNWEY